MANNKKGAIESLTDKLKSFPDRFTLADEQTEKDRKGFFKSKADKLKSFPDRFTLADEQTEKIKAKRKRKKAAEDMADLEFELGKKQKSGDVILPQQESLGKITEGARPFSAVNPKGSLPRKSPYFSRGGRAAIRGFKFGGIK